LVLAFASYFISGCLWSAFFTSKKHKPSHHVKVAVHGEGVFYTVHAEAIYNKGQWTIELVASTKKDQPLLSSKRRPRFRTHRWSRKEQKIRSWVLLGPRISAGESQQQFTAMLCYD
jgi:hypothetical protein